MRTSILLIRKHGSKTFELVAGPDVPLEEQKKEFNDALLADGIHPEIAELQRWESDSSNPQPERIIRFEKPEVRKARKDKEAKDYADHLERQKPKKPGKVTPKTEATKTEATKTEATNESQIDL